MIRWTYLVPRLIIFALLGLAVWLSYDSLLRTALVHHGEAFFGSKIEIGHLRSSLATSSPVDSTDEDSGSKKTQARVFLKDVQIADPRNPELNLFQADMAYLNVDFGQLLRRQFRISGGKTSDVSFGAPRTVSGLLPNQQPPELAGAHAPFSRVNSAAASHSAVATNAESSWLNQLQSSAPANTTTDSRTLKEAERIAAHWPPLFAETREKIAAIGVQMDQVEASLEQDNRNPLRTQYEGVLNKVAELHQQSIVLENQLESYAAQSRSELDTLNKTCAQDQQQLQQTTPNVTFDGEVISELLLAESQQQTVDEIMHWFKWFRGSIPDLKSDFRGKKSRGTDVTFAGQQPTPEFLVDQLDIEGSGRFANQHLNFAGQVFNFSSEPHHHNLPITFELRAQGNQHFVVNCTVDRRADQIIDTLSIRCPDLQIESTPLGTPNSMLVSVGPDLKMQAEVKLHAVGEQVSGELVFRHSHVSLHVDQLHALAGGKDSALRINQELVQFDQFQTRVNVSGTLSNYHVSLESDLGEVFADTLTKIANQAASAGLAKRTQDLTNECLACVEATESAIGQPLANMIADLQSEQQALARLKKDITETAKSAWPDIR